MTEPDVVGPPAPTEENVAETPVAVRNFLGHVSTLEELETLIDASHKEHPKKMFLFSRADDLLPDRAIWTV